MGMSITEFKYLNRSKGFYWFSPSAMSFFKSRICYSTWDYISGYFVSSEQGPSGIRKYTVRKANFETGNVETIGKFQAYNSVGAAKTAIKRIRKES